MSESAGDVTTLLAKVREGDQEAANRLIPLIYAELRRMARAKMRRERPGHTLQATALVHEAYLRMTGGQHAEWQNRAHFFALAADTMRQILLDHARGRQAAKRGGPYNRRVDIDAEVRIAPEELGLWLHRAESIGLDVIALDEALERLKELEPRQARLVELRFYAGLSVEEAAEVMGLAQITLKREWRSAKAWLHREMAAANSE
jgi:RNA polymerase sigma factor (TIGR02999 family)